MLRVCMFSFLVINFCDYYHRIISDHKRYRVIHFRKALTSVTPLTVLFIDVLIFHNKLRQIMCTTKLSNLLHRIKNITSQKHNCKMIKTKFSSY